MFGWFVEPLSGTKLFQFHGEICEKLGKMLKTNPLFMDLNLPSRNPGSDKTLKKSSAYTCIAKHLKNHVNPFQ